MSSNAPYVVTDAAGIRKLNALVRELPGNSHVVLFLRDGNTCEGMVTVQPSMQVFRDHEGVEGSNAEVQMERPATPAWHRRIWLDQIVRVEHLDSALASER
ncbi:MAG: DUF3247 family protein [Rhodanobacter sp.]